MVAESKTVLDNEKIKISEIRIGRGEKLPMHTHDRKYVTYVMNDATVRVTLLDGSGTVGDFKKGFIAYSDAGATHSIENIGSTDAFTLEIEPKY